MPYGPFGATAKMFRDRGVRFVCEPNKIGAAYELMIRYFNIFDCGGQPVRVGQRL